MSWNIGERSWNPSFLNRITNAHHGSENHSLSWNPAVIGGEAKTVSLCTHPEWAWIVFSIILTASGVSPIPKERILTPRIPTTRNNLAGSCSRGGEGRENKPKLQEQILEQFLFEEFLWIKLAFLGVRRSSKFYSTSEQQGLYWAPNKRWTYQTLLKSVFCTLQAAASILWGKENGLSAVLLTERMILLL